MKRITYWIIFLGIMSALIATVIAQVDLEVTNAATVRLLIAFIVGFSLTAIFDQVTKK